MKDVLDRLFKPTSPITTFAVVRSRLSTSRYELRDSTGRVKFANSTEYYPVGTNVIVVDGIITGVGRRIGLPKVYEV